MSFRLRLSLRKVLECIKTTKSFSLCIKEALLVVLYHMVIKTFRAVQELKNSHSKTSLYSSFVGYTTSLYSWQKQNLDLLISRPELCSVKFTSSAYPLPLNAQAQKCGRAQYEFQVVIVSWCQAPVIYFPKHQ